MAAAFFSSAYRPNTRSKNSLIKPARYTPSLDPDGSGTSPTIADLVTGQTSQPKLIPLNVADIVGIVEHGNPAVGETVTLPSGTTVTTDPGAENRPPETDFSLPNADGSRTDIRQPWKTVYGGEKGLPNAEQLEKAQEAQELSDILLPTILGGAITGPARLGKGLFSLFKKSRPPEEPTTIRPPGAAPGWESRIANDGKGVVWQRPGAPGNADMFRIKDPDPQYPNGSVRFYNGIGQPLDLDGKPGPPGDTHIPRNADGSYPIPKGWK